jgi:hypothetical protein
LGLFPNSLWVASAISTLGIHHAGKSSIRWNTILVKEELHRLKMHALEHEMISGIVQYRFQQKRIFGE